jgi:hypothetical protein
MPHVPEASEAARHHRSAAHQSHRLQAHRIEGSRSGPEGREVLPHQGRFRLPVWRILESAKIGAHAGKPSKDRSGLRPGLLRLPH